MRLNNNTKRLKGELNIVERKFDKTHAIAMLEDCKGSLRDLTKVLKWMRAAF